MRVFYASNNYNYYLHNYLQKKKSMNLVIVSVNVSECKCERGQHCVTQSFPNLFLISYS